MTISIPNWLLPKRNIRDPDKTYTDLTTNEVALMIEADSALTNDGNELFANCALDEFLHNAILDSRPDLQQIRTEILDNIYLDIPGSKNKQINTEYLIQYAKKLRDQNEAAL